MLIAYKTAQRECVPEQGVWLNGHNLGMLRNFAARIEREKYANWYTCILDYANTVDVRLLIAKRQQYKLNIILYGTELLTIGVPPDLAQHITEWRGGQDSKPLIKCSPEVLAHLRVLGLSASDASDLILIKKTYRQLACLIHPDKHCSDPEMARRFSELTTAYKALIPDDV